MNNLMCAENGEFCVFERPTGAQDLYGFKFVPTSSKILIFNARQFGSTPDTYTFDFVKQDIIDLATTTQRHHRLVLYDEALAPHLTLISNHVDSCNYGSVTVILKCSKFGEMCFLVNKGYFLKFVAVADQCVSSSSLPVITITKQVKRSLDSAEDSQAKRVSSEDAILFYCEFEEPDDNGHLLIRRSDALFEEDFDALFGNQNATHIEMNRSSEDCANTLHAVRLLASFEIPSEIGKDYSLWGLPRAERIVAFKKLTVKTFTDLLWTGHDSQYIKLGLLPPYNMCLIKLDYYC